MNTATVNPLLSMLRMRFSPITASPITPMSAMLNNLPSFRKGEQEKTESKFTAGESRLTCGGHMKGNNNGAYIRDPEGEGFP